MHLESLISTALGRNQRPPDGMLHPSSHITAPLRHVQLEMAGVPPTREKPLSNQMRLLGGTLIHDWIHGVLHRSGLPHMAEVSVTPWLPERWAGTADCLVWDPERQVYDLWDYKTREGSKMQWIDKWGAIDSHVLQISAYYMALEIAGFPMGKAYIAYIPFTDIPGTDGLRVEEVEITRAVWAKMESITKAVFNGMFLEQVVDAPKPERVQAITFDRKTNKKSVVLKPPWFAAYCSWDEPYCSCSSMKQTVVGKLEDGEFIPRKGFEDYEYKEG